MSVFDSLKSSKKPVIIIAAVIAAAVITTLFISRGGKTGKTQGNEVISKRIKIELPPASTTAPGEAKETAQLPPATAAPASAPATTVAVKKPETAALPAAPQKPLLQKPAVKETKPVEAKPAAVTAPVAAPKKPETVAKAASAPEKAVKKDINTAKKEKMEKAPAKKTSKKEAVVAKAKPVAGKKATAKTVSAREVVEKSWAINIASYPNQKDAEALRDSLKSAGYSAYITEFSRGGVTWHRVRVGFYRTQTDAKNAGKEITKKMKLRQEPWIVRPFSAESKGK